MAVGNFSRVLAKQHAREIPTRSCFCGRWHLQSWPRPLSDITGSSPPPLPPQVALEPLSSTGPLHSCVGSRVNVQAGTWSGTFHHCSNGGTRLCLHGWTKTLNRRMNSKSPVVSSIMSGVFRLARVSATQAQPHYQRGMVTCCDGCECCCSQLRNTAVGSKYRCGSQRSHCDANGEGCTMLYNFQHISLNCIF